MILDLVSFHRALGSSLATFTRGEKDEKRMSGERIAVIASWGDILQTYNCLAIRKARTLSSGAREVPEGSRRAEMRGVWIDSGSRGAAPALAPNRNRKGVQSSDQIVIKECYHPLISKELPSDVDGLHDGAVFQHEHTKWPVYL